MLAAILSAMLASGATVPADSVIDTPDWVRKPTAERMAELYPEKARASGRPGRVILKCKVRADGTLEPCEVELESPTGEGFGEAALRMAPNFKMKPLSIDGKAVGGGIVHIPVVFSNTGGNLDPLSGTLRCYGRMAAIAEADPANTEASLGARFWMVQSMAAAAAAHVPPSSLETEATASRVRASAVRGLDQVKYETDACDRAMKQALEPKK